MKTNIINLTSVPVTICNDNIIFTVAPSGTIAKTFTRNRKTVSPLCDIIPVIEEIEMEIRNLPRPQPDTVYIVGKDLGRHIHGRPDVFYPCQTKNKVQKDPDGKWSTKGVIGYSAFKPCF